MTPEVAQGLESGRIKRSREALAAFPARARSWIILAVILLGPAAFVFGWYWNFRRVELPRPHAGAAPPPPMPNVENDIRQAQDRLKVDPHDIGALVKLGIINFEKGKDSYPDAINALEDARNMGAMDTRIFYCLGIMYQELGLYNFAIDEYRRYLRNHPGDKEIRMLEAKLLYQQGRFPEAVVEYERLKFHYPNDGVVEENLGLSLWAAKQYRRATDSFTTLKSYGPSEGKRAEFCLGQLSFEQLQYNESLAHLLASLPDEKAQAVGVAPEKIRGALALTYQKLGRFDDARSAWEQVVALSPKDVKAQVALRELNRRYPPKKPKPVKKP